MRDMSWKARVSSLVDSINMKFDREKIRDLSLFEKFQS